MKRILLTALLFMAAAGFLFAADFGAVLSAGLDLEDSGDFKVKYKAILAPWVSVPVGEGDFYLSAGINLNNQNPGDNFTAVPELYRLDFSIKLFSLMTLRIGRIPWQDPSRFTFKGNFDGLDLLFDLGKVRLGAAGLYTGFLFKNTTEINQSPADTKVYSAEFKWNDFIDTYFAPRRVIASLYADFPGLLAKRGSLNAGLLAQFDLSGADERYHTQYLLLRYTQVYKRFDFTAGGALGLENTKADKVKLAFAFNLEGGFQTRVPVFVQDRLSLSVRYASGNGPGTAAYFPIVREAMGLAFKPIFSGIMVIRARYEARFLPSLSAELGARYFIRTDSTTFDDPDLEDNSYALGLEIGGSLIWVPLSDLSLTLAGGVFLPQTGGAFRKGAPVRWVISLGTVFSF